MATIGTTPSTMKSINKLLKGFCDPHAAPDDDDGDSDDDDVYYDHQGLRFQQSSPLVEERQEARSILSLDETKSREETFNENVASAATNYDNNTSTRRILFPACSADEDIDEDQEKKKKTTEKTLTSSRIPQDDFDGEDRSDNENNSQHQYQQSQSQSQSQCTVNHRLKRTTSIFISFVLVVATTWGSVVMIHLLQKNGVLDDCVTKIAKNPIVGYYEESELKKYVDRIEIKLTESVSSENIRIINEKWVEIIGNIGKYHTNNTLRRYSQPYVPSSRLRPPVLEEELTEKKSPVEDDVGIDSVFEAEPLNDITTGTEPMSLDDDVIKSKYEDIASANSVDSIRGYSELKEIHSSSSFKISNNKSEQDISINISTPVLNESKVAIKSIREEEKINNTINETTIPNNTKILDDFKKEVLSPYMDPEVFSEEIKSDEIFEDVPVVNEQLDLPGNKISSDEKSTAASNIDKLTGNEFDMKEKYDFSSNIANDDGIFETTEQFIDESSTNVSSYASDGENRSTIDFEGTMEWTSPLNNTSASDKTPINDQFDSLERSTTNDSIISTDNKLTAREEKQEYGTVERDESIHVDEEEKVTNPLIDQQTEESTASLPNAPAGVDVIESSTTGQSASVISQDEGNTDALLSKLKVRRHWNSPRGWVRRKQKPIAEAEAPTMEAASVETTKISESKEEKTVKEESSAAEAGQENENENAATATETEGLDPFPTDDLVTQPPSTTEPEQTQEVEEEAAETADQEEQQEKQQYQPPEQPEEYSDRGEEERRISEQLAPYFRFQ